MSKSLVEDIFSFGTPEQPAASPALNGAKAATSSSSSPAVNIFEEIDERFQDEVFTPPVIEKPVKRIARDVKDPIDR